MVDGKPVGRGATILTTRAGRAAVAALDLPVRVIDDRGWPRYGRVPAA